MKVDLTPKTNPVEFNPERCMPYGDTMNDGKVQLSFTLPIPADEKAKEAARLYAVKMGMKDPSVSHMMDLGAGFSFFVVYGGCMHSVDITKITVKKVESPVMAREEIDSFIRDNLGRKIVFLGASTGTDAHTVGIDAIFNMKGYAGHYGLERYSMIEAHNLGSQVPNEDLINKAIELNADAVLVSQTVTQKNIHIHNLTRFIELLEAEGLRDRFILCCGGPRISHELALELGFDAGFGPGKFAEDVASFVVQKMHEEKR
jgi:beta-lysine 5,6-aminomutase beta subunit